MPCFWFGIMESPLCVVSGGRSLFGGVSLANARESSLLFPLSDDSRLIRSLRATRNTLRINLGPSCDI